MKFGVNKKVLLYTAGCVWIFAGINILRIGIVTWLNDTHYWLFKIGEATIVFLLFFNLVFKRLFYKHSERISRKNGKHCPFSFFDVKGWIIMIFMIAFGITIRALHLLPNSQFSILNFQFPSFSQINSAAFLPLISMPPKIGPIRKLPLTPLAAIPETNNPG